MYAVFVLDLKILKWRRKKARHRQLRPLLLPIDPDGHGKTYAGSGVGWREGMNRRPAMC
jgi:hypothetical protein